ncbi:ORF6N domain-containing protein [Lactococcus sp. NH2-7C]|uniref:ORF6N domain-containing protein n=1 Tax=Lactococcus sp. NH2-7C TaxID=2879149 RepID=UPI001CDB8806|nr:ORF6N domain-containing protein [Lactococcus sp. NH2-7C]MCA2389932.1 ORF6C domain-containing protein [Lactococcus sp. NH2-7C]WGV30372.1 ORF6C domain-containing protein [Lactococcus sp. NH2-7C]
MNELQITELNGQRVLTTQQIADGYGTKKRTIVDNFGNNKSRFKEGKHFFLLDGEELKKFKDNNENFGVVGNRAPKLYLWTEKGALLHAKSLGTDEAWDMYDILVDTYFKVQEQQAPLTLDQQIAAIATGYGSVKEELVEVKDRVLDLEENAPLSAGEYNYIGSRITQRVNEVAHGYSSITQKQRGELYKDINRGVKVVTGISTRTQLRAKHFDTAMDFINNWEPSTATKMQLRQTSFDFEA